MRPHRAGTRLRHREHDLHDELEEQRVGAVPAAARGRMARAGCVCAGVHEEADADAAGVHGGQRVRQLAKADEGKAHHGGAAGQVQPRDQPRQFLGQRVRPTAGQHAADGACESTCAGGC
jgi:hypothetical protein